MDIEAVVRFALKMWESGMAPLSRNPCEASSTSVVSPCPHSARSSLKRHNFLLARTFRQWDGSPLLKSDSSRLSSRALEAQCRRVAVRDCPREDGPSAAFFRITSVRTVGTPETKFPGWVELQALATNSSGVQGTPTVMVLTSGAGATDTQGIGFLPEGTKPLGSRASADAAVEADRGGRGT